MGREFTFLVVALAFCGPAFLACGWWSPGGSETANATAMERSRWMRIWLPLLPGFVCLAALLGWASQESDPPTQTAPNTLILFAVITAIPIGRAVMRASYVLARPARDVLAATVGILSRYVVLSPRLIHELDRRTLDAVYEHELAHARHRDPLRVWLGQLACDLQWPWPGARKRFQSWLEALEISRDEEARLRGVNGPDLASGILTAARLATEGSPPGVAGIAGDAVALRRRIALLLAPLAEAESPSGRRTGFAAVVILLLGAAAWGMAQGRAIIDPLLKFFP